MWYSNNTTASKIVFNAITRNDPNGNRGDEEVLIRRKLNNKNNKNFCTTMTMF